jgi:hypothetical protein
MAHLQIDVEANTDIKDITAQPGGSVFADVRVVVREGVSASEAHKALQAISSAIIGDQIDLK